MKKTLSYCLLGAALTLTSACQKDADDIQQLCATSQVVKTITNAEGYVVFNQVLQQYLVVVPQPGTYDSVDYGVPCTTLPDNLRVNGTKVVVSGSLGAYSPQPASQPAGATYYYLEMSSIAPR